MKQSPICSYENSAWSSEFWLTRSYEDRAERIALKKLLPPSRGRRRLVEIGAGFGRLAGFYAGYERVILLDYARSMLQEARARLQNDPRFIFVVADLYQLPFANSSLDTAVTVRVLHHVADIPRAFAEIARSVRPRGAYVLEHANKRHLKAILRYALNRNAPNPYTPDPYEFVKLNFDFHPRYIEDNLRAAQFVAREKRAVSTFRIAALKRIVPAPLLAALDGVLQAPLAPLQISPSIFIRAESTKPGAPALNAALWRCVHCHSTDIVESREALRCTHCARIYPIVDGVIDFRVADAETR